MFRGRVRHVHFVGVGGIGMSGLAEFLRLLAASAAERLRPQAQARTRVASEALGVWLFFRPRGRER